MRLVDEIQVCETCEQDMDYVGLGEWNCECGHAWYAEWLDGPETYEWLQAQGVVEGIDFVAGTTAARMVRRWGRGESAASFYALDSLLIKLGLHVCEIPDGLWRETPRIGRPRKDITDEMRLEAVRRIDAGEEQAAVARELGVSPRAVSHWRGRLKVAA